MAIFVFIIVVGLITCLLIWCISRLIKFHQGFLANLLAIHQHLVLLLDNFRKRFPITSAKIESKIRSDTSPNAFNFPISSQTFIRHHRKKYLLVRKNLKFYPTLTTVTEEDETFEPIYNAAQNTDNIITHTPATQHLISQRANSAICTKQTSVQQQPENIPTPEPIPNITFDENFTNMSFLVPSFIVPPVITPTNINHPFAVQFCKYMAEKRKQKSLPFLKRKFKSIKKKFLKKIIHR
ncbi:hypothetical protein TNCV_4431501 [Trichonephila clavipes]|nr:hypothetical protein TNCV_4431501 [Trichonephila clavipes]